MVSDSDSVDTEGYFTSFRNECGFPKFKKSKSGGEGSGGGEDEKKGESEYELFGKGSTSTTASSCGTVVMRQKLELPHGVLIEKSLEVCADAGVDTPNSPIQTRQNHVTRPFGVYFFFRMKEIGKSG